MLGKRAGKVEQRDLFISLCYDIYFCGMKSEMEENRKSGSEIVIGALRAEREKEL